VQNFCWKPYRKLDVELAENTPEKGDREQDTQLFVWLYLILQDI